MKINLKPNERGITLIALIITIIILVILAAVSIKAVYDSKIVGYATNAAEDYAKEAGRENEILGETANLLESVIGGLHNSGSTDTPQVERVPNDGSWNANKKVNSPDLTVGLKPVTFNSDGSVNYVTDYETNDSWYDYEGQRWANAVTQDENGNITGYFVWIPRFAYRITSGRYTSTNGTIVVKYLKDDSNYDISGNTVKTDLEEWTNSSQTNYVVHPAFGTNINNGGWSSNLEGFWVAKFPAGFQANTLKDTSTNGKMGGTVTLANSREAVVKTSQKYTSYYGDFPTNALGQNLSSSGYTSEYLSLPVFTPLTYAYNIISTGDIYTISQEIRNYTNFYGLKNVDSHLEKNSEWGAVAYLTHSSYGRNGAEPNINNYYTNNSSPFNAAVTGLYINATSGNGTATLSDMYTWYSSVGQKGSSTGNTYGVYDLNGCISDRATAYITNGNASLSAYGGSYATKTTSTKYATVYPYNSSSDGYVNNYAAYKAKRAANYAFGDAVLETSADIATGSYTTGWHGDSSHFPLTTHPFFPRGGAWNSGSNAGVFQFSWEARTFGL